MLTAETCLATDIKTILKLKLLTSPCRPISCYKADLTKEITGDVELEEELVTCNQVDDVCFGRVILTVSNKTDTDSSQGYIQV